MISNEVVELSRLQFGLTAMYHFLFVPLTMGLAFLLAIMESVYVMSNKLIYKDMTQFWGKLFGINVAMGITTGITLEFQFGTNWAYYSHYVGDIFGPLLAIEGMLAFFLESTFIGLFFFGWQQLSKIQHLIVTWLLALGSSLSAMWILIANGWMQHPVGAEFNYETMRMELTSLADIFFNPIAQVKFVHTVAAGYTTGSMFVLGISAFYLLQNRDVAFARRSFRIAAGFGLASVLSVIVLGDESGYTLGEVQKAKLATIEAEWETEKPPASFTVFGIPNEQTMTTDYAIKIPWLMGLVATRSIDEEVGGIKEILKNNRKRIKRGMIAYDNLQKIRQDKNDAQAKSVFEEYKGDLGYGLLLKRYTDNVIDATPAQIDAATRHSIPKVAPMFWAFRGMVLAGFFMLFIFAASFYYNAKRTAHKQRWLLRLAVYGIPLPWIASELGWVVAEYGRQPWTIAGILPTHLSVSSVDAGQLYLSLAGFFVFYSVLLVIELFMMTKYIRLGPSSLHTGRYHFEQEGGEHV
ncbi:MAG: cytochrome bd-I ubiquinol oxidase subunit CydA [Gammaproteobacteria bacterium]|jgi:cytochrome bd ubiquinol oxidase subunit I|nr:cytochrome bd-I ubiquinol oxidase subunit CydA [Gammaproteobacteria bacterium]MBT5223490.1 cytochrome bd-I ubiquinol oxidase subunit CydA [Gammaproteobacteria bacterium]MBT5825449.1 cytochrome bd-I ubiquinol oxidase subunit CydA [Gammaproteobacteria bacterium]MBT5965740.1 cytochrome bd-I ubiquinol oxidase subunit CydA [Gammaproteobacteria bacterium]MBT6418792.1 cytochrome bd-I ubiquinol oxidase subunit CydA [Gammaproteobacteria bacterium]